MTVSAALAGLALPGATFAQGLIPGTERRIVRSWRFFDLETPVELLDTWITPSELFFVRNHMSEPVTFDATSYRLRIVGEVEHPVELTLADLAKMEPASITNTLECAGNGRGFYQPHLPGIQWQRGAVGTARFSGPRLRDVLARAGVKSAARDVAFKGLEEPPGKVPPFIRSIPIEKALHPDTLVAMHMNGAPLEKHHGYPARALVPGWIGAASCKWLSEIQVLPHPFEGNFMNPGYRMPAHPIAPGEAVKPEDTVAVTRLNVKSLITAPAAGARVGPGPVTVRGVAWAGEADVVRVEVSTDGGRSWHAAQLGSDHAPYTWRLWRYRWQAKPGAYTLMSRASDSTGRVQPPQSPWNPGGYLWNGMDPVKIDVHA